ncbi:MAG: hypothetical protein ACYC8T_25150 [Myxococcaceae bacterium]
MGLLLMLALGTSSFAEDGRFSAPPLLESVPMEAAAAAASDEPRVGLVADVGVPDGAGASLVVNPASWLRFQLGAIGNGAGSGVRLGAVLVPFHSALRPTLSVEAGYYLDGDARWLAGKATSPQLEAVLSNVTYQFANAHLGLELGSRRFAFFLRVGASYVDVSVPGLARLFEAQPGPAVAAPSAHLRTPLPSAKLGFVLFLL